MLREEGKQPATSPAMGGPTSEAKVEEGSKERYGPCTHTYGEAIQEVPELSIINIRKQSTLHMF